MKKIYYLIYFLLFQLPTITSAQESLQLESCSFLEFEINDHQDSDEDGIVCEAKIQLTNSAFYSENMGCALSDIKWTVTIDLFNDGTNDIEYRSDLPSTDNTMDDTNGNGIPDLYIPTTISNEVQTIQLPDIEGNMSNHKVTWSVSDDCDLGDLCVTNFSVEDKRPPTPFCVSLSTIFFNSFDIEIYAEDFNVGVYDNCTDQEDMKFSFSAEDIVPMRLITCDDVINSPVTIDVYFWDELDNRTYCTVILYVVPSSTIDCFPTGEIAGVVKGWRDEPLEGVEVKLDANAPDFQLTTLTDAEGKYSFGIVEGITDYTLSASFDEEYVANISTLDLVLIVRHILSLQPFENPYRIIASDVNGDKQVKASDVLILRKLILGIISEVSTNPAWKFIDANFEFVDPLDPFSTLLSTNQNPYLIEFNVNGNAGYDFIGIKIGDVSN